MKIAYARPAQDNPGEELFDDAGQNAQENEDEMMEAEEMGAGVTLDNLIQDEPILGVEEEESLKKPLKKVKKNK